MTATARRARVANAVAVAVATTVLAAAAHATSFEKLHDFDGDHGAEPLGAPLPDADGRLFGTTASGGAHGQGTLYVASGHRIHVLHDFGAAPGDGREPWGRLVRDATGHLVGTTLHGGQGGRGTVWHYDARTGLHVDHAFTGEADGGNPLDGLVAGPDGTLYGSTATGGTRGCGPERTQGCGAIVAIDPATRALRPLHAFDGADGGRPVAAPALRDGRLAVTTFDGGADRSGTVATMAVDGSAFAVSASTDGAGLYQSGLAADTAHPSGALWGFAAVGGDFSDGGIFRIEPDGTFTWVMSFPAGSGAYAAGLPVFDDAGRLYGTLPYGGHAGAGAIFRYDTASGAYEVLHEFDVTDGQTPLAALTRAPDGTLYGVTELGGRYRAGTLFRLVP